jgi:hypothetical protein
MWAIRKKRYRIMSIMDTNHSSCSVTVMVEAELVAALTNLPDFNTGNFRFSQKLPLSLASSSTKAVLMHLTSILLLNNLTPHPLFQPWQSIKPPKTTLLHASMREVRLVMYRHTINMHCACLTPSRNSQPGGKIACEHCAREAVVRIIRNL